MQEPTMIPVRYIDQKGSTLVRLGLVVWILGVQMPLLSQSDSASPQPLITYGPKGMHLETADGNNALNIDLRLQLRYSYPFDKDPLTLEDMNQEGQHILQIRRARLKMGGHALTPRLTYYMEFAFESPELIDFYATYAFHN